MTSRDELLKHHESSMTFAGELSFLRRKVTQDISNADIVVSGIPFDSATTFRPGARLGPQAIRAASVQLAELADHAFPSDVNLFTDIAIADYGDCELPSGYPAQVVERIFNHAQKLLLHDVMMISLGGDHFVTYPLLQAHAEKYGPLSLLHFDAHVGIIVPEKSVQVGIRSRSDDDYGFTVLDSPWVHEHGTNNTIARIKEVIGDSPTYLTFDIDCLDPAFAPGTGTPVAGGLTSMQALTIIRQLGGLNFIGMDLVEVAPAYDHAEITAIAAATIVHDFIALQVKAL